MNLRDFGIGISLISMFIIAMSGIINSFADDYTFNVTDFNSTYDKLSNISATSEEMTGPFHTEKIDPTSFWGIITAPWSALKLIISSISVLKDMLYSFSSAYPIVPAWFITGMITLVSFLIVFLIISTVFRRKT